MDVVRRSRTMRTQVDLAEDAEDPGGFRRGRRGRRGSKIFFDMSNIFQRPHITHAGGMWTLWSVDGRWTDGGRSEEGR